MRNSLPRIETVTNPVHGLVAFAWLGLAAAMFAFCALQSGQVYAGSFQVTPVRVEIPSGSTVATITLRNESETDDVVVQARPQKWSQEKGEDITTPTTEIVASPPIFTIKAGGTQIVRIGLRDANKLKGQTSEVTYRLFLTEVPPPVQPGFRGLQVALNVSIPIFFAPPGTAAAKPSMTANWQPDGKLVVSATNRGNMRLQIAEVLVTDQATKKDIARITQPRYVLTGQTVSWVTPVSTRAQADVRIGVAADTGEFADVVKPGTTQTNLTASPAPAALSNILPQVSPAKDASPANAPPK
jgi:fimbrial chaperone protein